MIVGTALIVLTWVLFNLPLWASIVITVLSSVWILFCLLFGVYFFNLDMKLLAVVQGWLVKMHDKKKKVRRI